MEFFKKQLFILAALCVLPIMGFSQEEDEEEFEYDDYQYEESTIRTLTPSKLIPKGKFDIKWFNNLFTSTRFIDSDGNGIDIERQNFFTSTLEGFVGVSELRRVNLGVVLEGRFGDIRNQGSTGFSITSIAPSIKISPFSGATSLSLQSSLFIPLVDAETDADGVFLDQDGFTWQNRFFYDLVLPGGDFQLFFELNTEYHFGDDDVQVELPTGNFQTLEGSFANNSFSIFPGVFFSYFPSSKFTVLVLTQHFVRYDLGDSIEQNFTASGAGVKYQLTKALNIEGLYTNFWRGENNNTGQTFNIGLRAVF